MSNLTIVKDALKKSKHTYSWNKAVGGDDPKKIKLDATKLNRKEGYEMAPFILNVLEQNHWAISEKNVGIIETDIHVHCKSQSRNDVAECIRKRYKK
jgi:hypothetical protein